MSLQSHNTGEGEKLAPTCSNRLCVSFMAFLLNDYKKSLDGFGMHKGYEFCAISSSSSIGGQQTQQSPMKADPVILSLLLLDQLQEETSASSLLVPPQKFRRAILNQAVNTFSLLVPFITAEDQ